MYIIHLLLFEMVVILYASYLNVAYMSKKEPRCILCGASLN